MTKHPNILFIMVDQLRYDCVGISQDYPVKTPNIDQLAKEGVRFTNAYTHMPVCGPARQSLLNGRRPETFGALWNYGLGSKVSALNPDEYSWPRELGMQGYQSAYLGKWSVHPTFDPTDFGYDSYVSQQEYEAFRKQKYSHKDYTAGIKSDETSHLPTMYGEIDPVPLSDTRTHWFAGKTIEAIERLSMNKKPWHIRIDFTEPHLPCNPHQEFVDMYDLEDIPEWRNFKEDFSNKPYIQKQQLRNWNINNFIWEDWAPIVMRYYAMISQLDHAIGTILKKLKQLGLDDDTLVVFTTDHGDMCGGHRMIDKHYVMYEELVKVPLIIKWPHQMKSNLERHEFVYNLLDISPTILEIVGVQRPEFLQGRSLLRLLKGEMIEDWRQEIVSTYNGQQFGLYSQRMLRTAGWKYIWNATDIDELYDLNNDREELINLIHQQEYQQIIKDLREKLYYILLDEGDTLIDNPWMKNQFLSSNKL